MGRWANYTGPLRPTKPFHKAAPFGWSATEKGGRVGNWVIYKRDCPEYLDSVPVFRTRADAKRAVEQTAQGGSSMKLSVSG